MINAQSAEAFVTKHCPRCDQMTTHRVVHGECCLAKVCMICLKRGDYKDPAVIQQLQQST